MVFHWMNKLQLTFCNFPIDWHLGCLHRQKPQCDLQIIWGTFYTGDPFAVFCCLPWKHGLWMARELCHHSGIQWDVVQCRGQDHTLERRVQSASPCKKSIWFILRSSHFQPLPEACSLTPKALLCIRSSGPCSQPVPPRASGHPRTPQQNPPLQEQRTDAQPCPEPLWKLNFFLLIFPNMESPWCHCGARGWPHSDHFLFPTKTSPFVNFHGHPRRLSPPGRHTCLELGERGRLASRHKSAYL